MTGCERRASGDPPRIVLYFYDELEPGEHSAVESHLRSCADCRRTFDDLSMIRSALSTRPRVDAPPDGDWTAFMQRLDEAVRFEQRPADASRHVRSDEAVEGAAWPTDVVSIGVPIGRASAGAKYAAYLAMAALLTLVTSGVVYVARSVPRPSALPVTLGSQTATPAPSAPTSPVPERSAAAAFAALSEQHFERSKLVVLGLANKDPHRAREADWAYERGLARNLLSDTRLYRLAAEERGMKTLAGVMGDLELVLLQTSLADAPDAEALGQIQRLIHKRDLVTKMDVASTTGS